MIIDDAHPHLLSYMGMIDVPLEAVLISLNPSFAPEPAATFFSTIAYPLPQQLEDRNRFRYALCRWAIHWQSEADPEWAAKPQPLKPAFFLHCNKKWPAIVDQGIHQIDEALVSTQLIVLPHYIARRTGGHPKSVIPGYNPTSKDMSYFCVNVSGMLESRDCKENEAPDTGNFSNRQWKPTRAVAHALLAFLACRHKLAQGPKRKKKLALNMVEWLQFPETIRQLIIKSEVLRKQLTSISKFRIEENQTIAFYFDLGGCRPECGWNLSGVAPCSCDRWDKPLPLGNAISELHSKLDGLGLHER
jgi:hypothetical protein